MRVLTCIGCVGILALGFAQGRQERKFNLGAKRNQPTPSVRKMTTAQARAAINKVLTPYKYNGPIGAGPYLNARTPWIDEANADFYHPGRWDTTYNSVFCESIHQVGSTPSEWDGTVGYVKFTPPAAGKYLILTHFTGYKAVCNVRGPWGTSSGTTQATSDDGLVTTLYTATNTTPLNFTFSFASQTNQETMGYWYGTEFIKI